MHGTNEEKQSKRQREQKGERERVLVVSYFQGVQNLD